MSNTESHPWEGCLTHLEQEILHDLLPSNVVRKMVDDPDAKSSCETRRVVVLVPLYPKDGTSVGELSY